jgi:hypothetical protein
LYFQQDSSVFVGRREERAVFERLPASGTSEAAQAHKMFKRIFGGGESSKAAGGQGISAAATNRTVDAIQKLAEVSVLLASYCQG